MSNSDRGVAAPSSNPAHARKLIALVLAPLVLGGLPGCSAPERHALPEALAGDAVPVGLPGVRYWGDTLSPDIEQAARDSAHREIAWCAREGREVATSAHFLALSGGGANGAFGAGLLCGWTAAGDRPEFKLVTGISTGALIAPFAFLGPAHDATLREFFTTLDTDDLLKKRGVLSILFNESAADSAPLAALIARLVDEKLLADVAAEHAKGRLLFITTTHLDADRPVIWDMGRIAESGKPGAIELFRAVMLASASIPGIFPPVMLEVEAGGERYDEMHVDGGACSQVFVYPQALNLKELAEEVGRLRPRTVWVVRNSRIAPEWSTIERRTLKITARSIEQMIRTQGIANLFEIYGECARDGSDFRLAYIPDEFVMKPKQEFDPDYMSALFDLAERAAKAGYAWHETPPGYTAGDALPRAGAPIGARPGA